MRELGNRAGAGNDWREWALARELRITNRKRIVRQAIHIGTDMTKIAGAIVALTAGPGAPAGMAAKLAASATELTMPIFRAAKQKVRNVRAESAFENAQVVKQTDTDEQGREVDKFRLGAESHVGSSHLLKSSAAKLDRRTAHAVTILMMVKDLLKFPAGGPRNAQEKRVKSYVRAAGCSVEKLAAPKDDVQDKIKLLVEEISKREW